MIDVVEKHPAHGNGAQMIVAGGRGAAPASRISTQGRGVRLEVPTDERRESPLLVLQVSDVLQVLDTMVDGLHVSVHHGGRRVHAQLVGNAMHVEPFPGTVLAKADDVAHLVAENLGAGAGDRIESGIAQADDGLIQRQLRQLGDVDDLRRRQAVLLHRRVPLADLSEQVLVVFQAQPGIEPPLHENLVRLRFLAPKRDEFIDLGEDLVVGQRVPFRRTRGAIEGAEVTLHPAHIGVIDVAPHVVRDHRLRVPASPHGVGQQSEFGHVRMRKQPPGVVRCETLAGGDLLGNVLNHDLGPTPVLGGPSSGTRL